MYLNDCLQHRFPIDYAHINSVQVVDEADIIASFRGCSQVWRIDRETGAGEWLLGRSNRSDAEWERKGIRMLKIVGDPEGEFCGQHSARLIPNGHLLLFDNGNQCLEDPETRDTQRTNWEFSRVVEYALDPDNGEAVFVRQHCLGNTCDRVSASQGHIHRMDSGHWLISWGRGPRDPSFRVPDASVTEVDPLTNEELLAFKITHPDYYAGPNEAGTTRAYPVEFVALADTPGPLTAEIVTRAATSAFHTGSGTAQVVVAFSRPVKNFAAETPSLSVTGAEVTDVAPHIEAGAPANAYVLTLDPTGDEAVSVKLVADVNDDGVCTADEICTADGTPLTGVPETAHTIPGPVQVSFDEAAYTVTEGRTVEVVVELDRTHDRPGPLEIPLRVQSGGTDAGDTEYTVPTIVTFDTTETEKTVSVEILRDTIIEEPETVVLGFGSLPTGVTPGTPTTTRVTITDKTPAAEFTLILPDTVAEGDPADLTVRIDNEATFSTEQTVTLTFSGAAERGSDYTVDADTLRLQEGRKSVTADIIEVVDDADAENAETIIVTAQHNGRQIGSQTVTILGRVHTKHAAVCTCSGSMLWPPQDVSWGMCRSGSGIGIINEFNKL